MADQLQHASQQTQQSTREGLGKWEAMSEDQKKQAFDSLPEDKKHGRTYLEWLKEGYQNQYENWMPWIEDQYLKWFTKDNKASYTAKDTLDKSKVTGVQQVDSLQDGVNNLAAGQVGQGGLLQPVGDAFSKEGIGRAERGGKDDKGTYGGAAASVTDPAIGNAKAGGESVASGAQNIGSSIASGAKSAGGYLGGFMGKEKGEKQ